MYKRLFLFFFFLVTPTFAKKALCATKSNHLPKAVLILLEVYYMHCYVTGILTMFSLFREIPKMH